MANSVVCFSPAKLNLTLRIVRERSDGWHELDSVMTLIDWCDTIRLTVNDSGVIRREWQHEQVSDEADLTIRAARLLQREAGVVQGVSIAVEKRIPIGGGLGGGSSNAATVLLALNRLWEVNWDRDRLISLAVSLGADIPFFIFGESARMRGVGERLTHYRVAERFYLLGVSSVLADTAAVYQRYRSLTDDEKKGTIEGLHSSDNDLAVAAVRLYPQIQQAITALATVCSVVSLSGSGATVFSSFERFSEAESALTKLPSSLSAVVVAGLGRHPMLDDNFGE